MSSLVSEDRVPPPLRHESLEIVVCLFLCVCADLNEIYAYTLIGAVDEEAPTSLYNTQGPVIALVGEELRLKCLFAGK